MGKMLINKSGSGVLFPERNKQNPKGPDLRGGCNIGGVEYEIAAWQKVSKGGMAYVSLSVKPAQEQATEPTPTDGEDIPF